MRGALDLTKPRHLLEKLAHEMKTFARAPNDSYAALNALRDAYHLREWIWHDRLEHDPALQKKIIGASGAECDWNHWVNQKCKDFAVVHDLCNGSKHFEPDPNAKVQRSLSTALDRGFTLDSPAGVLDGGGFFADVGGGSVVSVSSLLNDTFVFWGDMFETHPELN